MLQNRLFSLKLSGPHSCWSTTLDGCFTHEVPCPIIDKVAKQKAHLGYDEKSYLLFSSPFFAIVFLKANIVV